MLHLIYGKAGSGKTTLLLNKLKELTDSGQECLFIVPEQQVLITERAVCQLGISSLTAEVTSFRRLCNSIFRTYGGLCYRYIGKGARKLLCWKALVQTAPLLSFGVNDSDRAGGIDPGRVDQFSSAIMEMTLYNLSPQKLSETAPMLEGSLQKKVEDLALVSALYHHLLHHEYDDPAEDLTRASELLETHAFFKGKTVFLDAYAGFTPQQADFLRHVFAQSEEVYLTIPCLPGGDDWLFAKPAAAEASVRRIAALADCRVVIEAVLGECQRAVTPALAHLAGNLWGEKNVFPSSEGIRLLECADLFEEADAAAASIAKLVQEGARYNEIAIVARSADRYDGILDSALERYNIPYYTSCRRDISTMPEIRLIYAALSVAAYDWQTEDVIAYLRTYLAGLTPDECDPVEEYAYLWKIRGKRWNDGIPWNMNPRGFAEEFTDEDQLMVDHLNQLRDRMTPPLAAFCQAFEKHPTVRSVSQALFDFLVALDIPNRLQASAEKNRNDGDRALADTQTQVWNYLMDSLDQLVTILGDESVDPLLYSRLLSMLLKESDIGTIPSGQDQVLVGSADLLRGSQIKHVLLLGVCEGVFPASDGAKGYFDDRERAELAENDLQLAEGGEAILQGELYYFYTTACCASHSLTMTYTLAEGASMAIQAVTDLFTDLKAVRPADWIAEEWCYTYDSALYYGLTHPDDPVGQNLLRVLTDRSMHGGAIRAAEEGISVDECQVNKALLDSILPIHMELSPSRLERYVNCPYSYFLRYLLYLAEPKDGDFKSANTGTFIHKLLEVLVPSIALNASEVDDEQIREMVEKEVDDYRRKMLRDWQDPRLAQLFERSKPFANLLLRRFRDEFKQSAFKPVACEVTIGRDGISPLRVKLEDGSDVSVKGIVDRVDAFEKDGEYYLRVVDYKTYDKPFSREDLQKGLDTQMLLYLYSLCEQQSVSGAEQLKIPENATVKPAGILYLNVGTSGIPKSAAEEVDAQLKGYFHASGLLLSNDGECSIPLAMEEKLEGRYIPVKLDRYGKISRASQKSLANEEEFEAIKTEVTSAVAECGAGIRGGVANAHPLSDSKHDGCQYCKMRPVCRRRKE